MDTASAIVQRVFITAADRVGSVVRLAEYLDVPHATLTQFLHATASPTDAVLAKAVDLVLDELPALRRQLSHCEDAALPPLLRRCA